MASSAVNDENELPPPSKRPRPSLSLKKRAASNRFRLPIEKEEFDKAAEGVVPTNTRCSTNWAMRTFMSWARERNERVPDNQVPLDLLENVDADKICHFMRLFVLEARKADAQPYPPSTIRSLLSGINRVLQSNKASFSILDKQDHRFRELHLTLDSVSSDLHRQGIGASRKSAAVIKPEEEDALWEKGLLGKSSPKVLQHTVFYYMGMQFVLRGVQEQHDLLISQLTRFPSDKSVYLKDVYYQYTEFISKNNQHRFKDVKVKNKTVIKAYALPDSPKCLVSLLDTYLSRLPEDSTYFYVRPLVKVPSDAGKPWYTKQRVGVNTLKEIIPQLFAESKLEVKYTNHSLRATAVTQMFNNGVPEKIIAEKSGHRSLESLRSYEHTSETLARAAGDIIADQSLSFVGEKEKPPDVASNKENAVPMPPTFSGNMSNCTINMNITYGK